jgi:hypothetical protein
MTRPAVQRSTWLSHTHVDALITDNLGAELSDAHALTRNLPPPENPGDFFLVDLRAQIAHKAYLIAERRGFAPGNEQEDWLQAEREVLAAPID